MNAGRIVSEILSCKENNLSEKPDYPKKISGTV